MTSYLATLNFALGITAPIFLLVVLGIVLKRLQVINEGFITSASWLVFSVGLPTLLFISIIKTHFDQVLNLRLLGVGVLATVAVFVVLQLASRVLVRERDERGIFVQGSFRGNMGIIGLAFCANAYGEEGLAIASIYMAVLTILYNVLSVYILTRTLAAGSEAMLKKIAWNIGKNPIVISIVFALLWSYLGIGLHPVLMQSGEYLSAMTLPLALLCIGGSISLRELRLASNVPVLTVIAKLVLVPAATVLIAYPFGFTAMELGVVFLMAATPTATASYIMVHAMGGKGSMAANIVALSTLASVLSVSGGIVILKAMNLI
ncbi:AEC family transporter [Gilvimarinus sp. F26214L]|uniref:AEC family transporter n=1 Tax=Gilvimarinus sp. DZF01 TaxID=3461371 RepID=UPI004045F809